MKKISAKGRSSFGRLPSILLLLFSALLFLTLHPKAFASESFSTFYKVSYEVLESQTAKVTLNIELKNNTSDYYVGSYNVQTGFRDVKNINASDSLGLLQFDTKENDKGVQISFSFNKNVVGINNIQKFKVSFETSEVAKNSGSIWEVNIPGVSSQEEFEEFDVTVKVPNVLGNPTIIKPHVKDVRIENNILHFSKKDLGASGISIAYGESQIYKFNLRYHLENPRLFPIQTEIAIPSNNNYQEVRIENIIPKPIDVYIDKDGNWLAKYKLLPSENIDVKVMGIAKVSYKPRRETLTKEQKNLFLKPQKYWEADSESVKKLAKELKTPEAIYKYVVENLKYDAKRIKDVQVRAGVIGVLKNKNSAVCLEFTDLFIALSRAAGIPARAVEGYANTNNSAQRPLSLLKDILHAWPEYYDFQKKAWIMVDPTWENTTKGLDYFNVFDSDHFAFVIKGEDSEYPVPAGGYKILGKEDVKDVDVSFSKTYGLNFPALTVSTDFSEKYLAGLPIGGELILENLSGVLSPNQTIQITADGLKPKSQNLYFDKIPPYGKKTIKVKFEPESILTNEERRIKIQIGRETIEAEISISPFYKDIYFIFGGIIIGIIAITLSALIRKYWRIHIS